MKVLFDCRYVRLGRHDGISRYSAELVGALSQLMPVTMLISDRRQLEMLPDLEWELVSAPTSVMEPFIARELNALNPDVVFSPMQTIGSFGKKYPLIVTVHDLIYYSHPTAPRNLPGFVRLLWRLYHLAWWPQRMLLARADAVVTVSETTQTLLSDKRLYPDPAVVVRNAAHTLSPDQIALAHVPQTARTQSLVYMGSFMPYKNVETLVRATERLERYELHLMSKISPAEQSRLTQIAPRARLIFHNGASDDDYRDALRHATALVTASRDEGFGIPLVEAMREATPIIVSDIAVFREIGGEAGLYFAPDDVDALVRTVQSLEDPATWHRHSQRSIDQAQVFSWSTSATVLSELIEKLAGSKY